MLNRNSVTILWWTVPFRWIIWFATIFASVIGFFEVIENYLSIQLPIDDIQQIPAALFSSGVGVIFLTNEKILNAHKNIKNIDSLSERLAQLEASMTPQQLREFEKIEQTTEKLAEYGIDLDPWHENKLGKLARLAGRNKEAQRHYQKSYDDFLRLNDEKGQAQALDDLGNVERTFGNLNDSTELCNQSLEIRTKIDDKKGISYSLTSLGNIAWTRGDLAEAERLHRESLAIRREIGYRQGEATSLKDLGELMLEKGDIDTGKKLIEDSHLIEREIGIPMIGGEFFENFD